MEEVPIVMLIHPDGYDATHLLREIKLSCPEYRVSSSLTGWGEIFPDSPRLYVWSASAIFERHTAISSDLRTILLVPTDLTPEQRFYINAAMGVWGFDLVTYGEFANIMLREIVEFLYRLANIDKAESHG